MLRGLRFQLGLNLGDILAGVGQLLLPILCRAAIGTASSFAVTLTLTLSGSLFALAGAFFTLTGSFFALCFLTLP